MAEDLDVEAMLEAPVDIKKVSQSLLHFFLVVYTLSGCLVHSPPASRISMPRWRLGPLKVKHHTGGLVCPYTRN